MSKLLVLLSVLFFSVPSLACKMSPLAVQSEVIKTIIHSLQEMSSKRVNSIESITFKSQRVASVKIKYRDRVDGKQSFDTKLFEVQNKPNCHFYIK